MTEKYIPASEVQGLKDYLASRSVVVVDSYVEGRIDERGNVCKRLDALLASAVELPEPGLRKAGRRLLANLRTVDVQERTVTLTIDTALWENWQEDTRHHPPVPDDKLREVVEKVAKQECSRYGFGGLYSCDRVIKNKAGWCISCRARAALRKEGA